MSVHGSNHLHKCICDDRLHIADDALAGLVESHSSFLVLDPLHRIVYRRAAFHGKNTKVGVICGGGSGHEPSFSGLVGEGMLAAAVCGTVFASPSVPAIVAAITRCAAEHADGVLVIIMNYSGDKMNFGVAVEAARSAGIAVDMLIVADDVSIEDPRARRGLCGTVLVNKIAGAAAHAGKSLAQVAEIARSAAARVHTIGVGLSACINPELGHPGFSLGNDEMEVGLGIHGERGVNRRKMGTAGEIASTMVQMVAQDFGGTMKGQRIAVVLNRLGGTTTALELGVLSRHVLRMLTHGRFEAQIDRVYQGSFMTALDMAGASLTVLSGITDDDLRLLDAPCSVPGWPSLPASGYSPKDQEDHEREHKLHLQSLREKEQAAKASRPLLSEHMHHIITRVAKRIESITDELTLLDTAAGDGDCGVNLGRGAHALLEGLKAGSIRGGKAVGETMNDIADIIRSEVGGSSGVLFAAILYRAASSSLKTVAEGDLSVAQHLPHVLKDAIDAVANLGGAHPGDRTMLDALIAAQHACETAGATSAEIAARTMEGAKHTATMEGRAGTRASFVMGKGVGTADPGAIAIANVLAAILLPQ